MINDATPPAIHIFLVVDIPVSETPEMSRGDARGETPEETSETPEEISSRIGSDTVEIRSVI